MVLYSDSARSSIDYSSAHFPRASVLVGLSTDTTLGREDRKAVHAAESGKDVALQGVSAEVHRAMDVSLNLRTLEGITATTQLSREQIRMLTLAIARLAVQKMRNDGALLPSDMDGDDLSRMMDDFMGDCESVSQNSALIDDVLFALYEKVDAMDSLLMGTWKQSLMAVIESQIESLDLDALNEAYFLDDSIVDDLDQEDLPPSTSADLLERFHDDLTLASNKRLDLERTQRRAEALMDDIADLESEIERLDGIIDRLSDLGFQEIMNALKEGTDLVRLKETMSRADSAQQLMAQCDNAKKQVREIIDSKRALLEGIHSHIEKRQSEIEAILAEYSTHTARLDVN